MKGNKNAQVKKSETSNIKHSYNQTYLLIWIMYCRVPADYNTAPLLAKTDMLKHRETMLSSPLTE